MSPTAPLDQTHADSVAAVAAIRRRAELVAAEVAAWAPAPCPPREVFP